MKKTCYKDPVSARKEALREQLALAKKIRLTPLERPPRYVAGVDCAFVEDKIIAVAVVFRVPELICVEEKWVIEETEFPYIPGLLSFREGPALVSVIKRLSTKPDVILFDGQGIAHPRRVGIATHIGILLDVPTIGCAKSKLVGEYEEPEDHRFAHTPLVYKEEVVGVVLRTKKGVLPIFVSPGHRITVEDALRVVTLCVARYRLPEPVRRADLLSKRLRKEYLASG